MRKGIFVTATDTGVGKTVFSLALATLLKNKGINVGFMKPVQCGGFDRQLLKSKLKLKDSLELINPYFAKEPVCPSIAFARQKIRFDKNKILNAFKKLQENHEFLIVEGAGGLFVPLSDNYLIADLIQDLDLAVIIVSRLGLGAINHSLLTIKSAQDKCIEVAGVVFNNCKKQRIGISEKSNPQIIKDLGKIPILGILPYFPHLNENSLLKAGKKINLSLILKEKSEDINWQAQDKKYLWHPFTQMQDWLAEEQLIIEEAKGSYLKDTNGKWYLDGVSSLWVNLHGHRKEEINSAVRKQLNKVAHSTLLGLGNVPSIELAKKLIKIAPRNLTKVFYSDNGSTAVEIALKIAYQYWQNIGQKQRHNFIHLKNSYHGDTLGSVSVGGIDLFHKIYQPLLFDSISVESLYCYRCPKDKKYPSCKLVCLKELENVLKKNARTICGLIVEPIVQAAAGIIVWPNGALKKMRQLCHKYNCLLIVDEVATGFGRTGKMFVCQEENVSPDILILSKGITGGYLPLAATLTTQKIFDGFLADYKDKKTFFHGHTYTANPLACSAAIANLEIFEKEKTLERLAPKINFLKNELRKFWVFPHVGDIRQKGFMVGIELVKDKKTKVPYDWKDKIGIKVCQEVRNHGLILRPLGDVIVLMPPLAITREELKKMLDIIFQAIKKITEASP